MLKVGYYPKTQELLVDGMRHDYERLVSLTREMFQHPDESEVSVEVASTGDTPVTSFIVRRGTSPNRIFCESGRVIFAIAPTLLDSFLSFISFPADSELPDSPVQYHHHYDRLCGGGGFVSDDSPWVVFGLERAHEKHKT